MKAKQKVLLLGSGALKIGEAGEFDYSGSQAIKALKEEGLEVVVVNPNIATVQTDKGFADRIYFLPVTAEYVAQIIARERPQGLLASFGGQTGLNCAVELHERGVLKRFGVQVMGTPVQTIQLTEDRDLFAKKLAAIGVRTAPSRAAHNPGEAQQAAEEIGYPVMIRAAFALGGRGSGVCRTRAELTRLLKEAFSHSHQVLVERYLGGWKEVEYEVVRDALDHVVTVCNMENLDPMGIHTGESVVVAPSQTLTDREYHWLREVAIKTVRALKVVGECNIQFALSPKKEDYAVIEVNARLSRSSALASKATGYPLAWIAAKLALGKSLVELRNSVTKSTSAYFEPALDYIVVKIPKWDLAKFERVSRKLTSEMKSVGEVMGIGRTFEEAFQKALRMTGVTALGFETRRRFSHLEKMLSEPTDERLFAVGSALRRHWTVEKIRRLTDIDPWFLDRMKNLLQVETRLETEPLGLDLLQTAKKMGFSDTHIAQAAGTTEAKVRARRKRAKILPVVKQIDTLAAEYPAKTNYLYLTYHGTEHDVDFHRKPKTQGKIAMVGSGPYKIGSSVEFDWCCVNGVRTLRKLNWQTLMVNCNPETVSTDYDECDSLYFEELSRERILDIWDLENPDGIVISMGGQIPNTLVVPLSNAGVRILGTAPDAIDNAEDRNRFSQLLDELGANQPTWCAFNNIRQARAFAHEIGYPVLVRPSYVLSGAAMKVAYTDEELSAYLQAAAAISKEYPVVISQFIPNAKEIEFDAVAQDGEIKLYAISEHIENAGVHSGDATMVLPAQRIYLETQRKIKRITQGVAERLKITGPFNIQFIASENEIYIIELNLRASRSFPFVSKVYDRNFIELAMRAIVGDTIPKTRKIDLDYVAVKAPQFSFSRLKNAEPALGVEMSSTGEVACFGEWISEAYLKAINAVGYREREGGIYIDLRGEETRFKFMSQVRKLLGLGRTVYVPDEQYYFLRYNHLDVERMSHGEAIAALEQGRLNMVIYIPNGRSSAELAKGYELRRASIDLSVPLITNLQNAVLFVNSLYARKTEDLAIRAWDEYLTSD
ncbi:MAG: carbamoyl-phosphate synthase (glutamine-hydrolyzing) large subunit [Planctomycetota bacterium]